MAGADMIRSAELRAVTTEFKEYKTAVNNFQLKYNGLPGDLPDAGAYWGYASGGAAGPCNNPESDTGTDTQTCDGNGNGRIGCLACTTSYEGLRVWQHLANAGLIEGSYTGVDPDGGSDGDVLDHFVGENAPVAGIGDNVGWALDHQGSFVTGSASVFHVDYGHALQIGREDGNLRPHFGFLTPAEAYNIDTKIDDGQPGRGKMLAKLTDANDSCTETAPGADDAVDGDEFDAVYQVSHEGQACAIAFPKVVE